MATLAVVLARQQQQQQQRQRLKRASKRPSQQTSEQACEGGESQPAGARWSLASIDRRDDNVRRTEPAKASVRWTRRVGRWDVAIPFIHPDSFGSPRELIATEQRHLSSLYPNK